jgi:hypothetical protein
VCDEDRCAIGRAEGALKLRAAPAGVAPEPANAARLEPHRKKLPQPLKELSGARASFAGARDEPIARFAVAGAQKLDFYPLKTDGLELHALESAAAGELAARFRYRAPDGSATPRVRGVLAVHASGGPRYYRVELPFDAADASR